MVFVDSNVILDVITADPLWQAWSEEQLSRWFDVMGSQLNRLEAVLP
jgi:predicted nucleic acid-binding protein